MNDDNAKRATPAKLRSGAWGARVEGEVRVGDRLRIEARSGKAWTARVTEVVARTGDGATLVATGPDDGPPAAAPKRATRWERQQRRATTRRTVRQREPGPGEQLVHRRSRDRLDCYDVGAVLRLARVAGGGGPDGHFWTVVAQAGRWRDDDTDEWHVSAIVRPATDEEAAPVVARLAAAERRKNLLAELGRIVRSVETHTDEQVPAGGRELVMHRTLAGSRRYVLASDGAVWEAESSYDDTPRQWCTRDPRAAEILRELLDDNGART